MSDPEVKEFKPASPMYITEDSSVLLVRGTSGGYLAYVQADGMHVGRKSFEEANPVIARRIANAKLRLAQLLVSRVSKYMV